ncbi:MAG TPA: oligosaccharide flippase family protein [Solirubrobacteraceae bacterium]|nr:oligosaccharide flippase family protein [Solirubrobacteraceae bacterium]
MSDEDGTLGTVPSAPAGEEGYQEPDILDTSAAGGLVIRGGVLRLTSYVAVVGLSVVSAAILTRYLGVSLFGRYTTVISLVSIVTVVTDAGMSSLGTREYAVREGADRDALIRDLLGLRVALTTIGVLLATAFAALAGYDTPLLLGTVVASVATFALVYQHTLSIPLSTDLRLGTLALLEFARQLMTVIVLVALVLVGAGVLPLLAVNLLVYLVLVPVNAALVRGRMPLRVELRPRRWLSLLGLTVSFSLATAVGTIYIYTAQILASLVTSEHQSGLFAVSFRVYIALAAIPGLLVGGALPLLARAARDDRKRLSYALQRIFEVGLILGIATALGLLAGARFIEQVVGGPKYAGAVEVIRIQGFGMIASFLIASWGYALLSIKRYGALLAVNAAALLVSAAATLVLAAAHGAQGAAVATLCGEATLALGCLIVLIRDHPELRPHPSSLPRVLLAAVPPFAAALLLNVPSLALTVVVLLVYFGLIAVTRAVPQEIVDILLVSLRRSSGSVDR